MPPPPPQHTTIHLRLAQDMDVSAHCDSPKQSASYII